MKNIHKYLLLVIIVIIIYLLYSGSMVDKRLSESYHVQDPNKKKCIPYRKLTKSMNYQYCQVLGYVLSVDDPDAMPLMFSKCVIGVPADTVKYKITIDNFDRYSRIYEYNESKPNLGSLIRFDNGKLYRVIDYL